MQITPWRQNLRYKAILQQKERECVLNTCRLRLFFLVVHTYSYLAIHRQQRDKTSGVWILVAVRIEKLLSMSPKVGKSDFKEQGKAWIKHSTKVWLIYLFKYLYSTFLLQSRTQSGLHKKEEELKYNHKTEASARRWDWWAAGRTQPLLEVSADNQQPDIK